MQKRVLDDWLEAYMEYTKNTETSTLYRKWAGIFCISSAMQRKIKLEWGISLTFYPNMYIVLIGRSATGKGTALRPALDLIRTVPGIKLASQATSLQALISELKNNNLTDVCPDGSMNFHSSMSIYSEEFTVFLGYKNNELITCLCNWYDCEEDWTYSTISRSKERIKGVWVTMIAGTTPDLIRSSLPPDSIGGGLTSRIIFVYADRPDHMAIFPTVTEEERNLFSKLSNDLEAIYLTSGSFKWTAGFSNLWADWRVEDSKNPPFDDPKFDGYCGRRKVHLLKLAMIMNLSRPDGDLVLRAIDLEKAIEILKEAELTMPMVFRGFGRSSIAELVYRSQMFFARSKTNEILYKDFAKFIENDADKMTMDRVLDTLEATGAIKVIKRPGLDSIIKITKRLTEVN